VTVACTGFPKQAIAVGEGFGFPKIRVAEYPGHISTHKKEIRLKNYQEALLPQIRTLLTKPVPEEKVAKSSDPGPREIVFKGSFEEINKYFYENMWSDGLPIVPPTIEKVEEFLKYMDRSPEEVVGSYLPSNRVATVWTVAVNGVMSGCRPEYMPVLLAIVEAMADPTFRIQDGGSTPGWEAAIILNGPISQQLGFNDKEGVRRPGYQANTTVGRFYRLFSRNVPRLLPGISDKATFGQMFRAVIPESEEVCDEVRWEPVSVQRGFKAGENVITIFSVRYESPPTTTAGKTTEEHLDRIALWLAYQTELGLSSQKNVALALLVSPVVAREIAKGGYSVTKLQEYLFEHSKIPASEWEVKMASYLWSGTSQTLDSRVKNVTACDLVKEGKLAKQYCESTDPKRLLPVYFAPDQLMIVVTGDPSRNRHMFLYNNQEQGFPVSKRIRVPKNWDQLLKEAKDK
jgi:hypothetical protein